MVWFGILLLVNAALHGFLVLRFGLAQNAPFAIFTAVYLVLAVIVFLAVPYSLWITLVLAAVGLIGLTVTFNSVARDKTLDRVIWAFDAASVLGSLYLLFVG
jgi:hypothetical protein